MMAPVNRSGTASIARPFITSFSISSWLPEFLVRWYGWIGASGPPTSRQFSDPPGIDVADLLDRQAGDGILRAQQEDEGVVATGRMSRSTRAGRPRPFVIRRRLRDEREIGPAFDQVGVGFGRPVGLDQLGDLAGRADTGA